MTIGARKTLTELTAAGGWDRVTALFEHSPWVEARADSRPSSGDRHADVMAVVRDATPEERLALIRAHPELAGKAAIDGALTDASAKEQASAGLDRMTAAEYDHFHALNTAYGARFGFPFIVCVRLTDKPGILAAMATRLHNDRDVEVAAAIDEIGKIVRLRLADQGLAGLNLRVKHDLACLDHGQPDWVRPRTHNGDRVIDVAIVGGGQSGLAAAFALQRERIGNILVLDENRAGYEGPWDSYARMRTLRTPKTLTGIDLGIPSLTFRAFWEAQHGAAGWVALGKIPRRDWMAYLRWYRRVLDLPVRNDARVTMIEPIGERLHRVSLADGSSLVARKVVLATGIQGGGEWHVPRFVREALPPERYAHTSQDIDYAALAGKRIAILGGGASAFDNATAALEAGVAEAHVFIRRPALPRVNAIRFLEANGFLPRYPALDDAAKYAVMADFLDRNQPPTADMFAHAAAFSGFALHTASPWTMLAEHDGAVRVTTPKGRFDYDFVVLSTGIVNDAGLRPELARVADAIAHWGDRVPMPDGTRHAGIDAHPYLGPGFEFLPREASDAARLHGLYAFNYSALVSLGLSAAALSGLAYALPRLAKAIGDALFLDDQAALLDDFFRYDVEEFTEIWPRPEQAAAE